MKNNTNDSLSEQQQQVIDRIYQVEAAMQEEQPEIVQELLSKEAKQLHHQLDRMLATVAVGDCDEAEENSRFMEIFHARDAAYRASKGYSAEQMAECRLEAMMLGETDSPWHPYAPEGCYYDEY